MNLPHKCEADVMDFAYFGVGLEDNSEPVPPCDNDAEIGARGYWLCRGCFGALSLLVSIAGKVVKEGPHS